MLKIINGKEVIKYSMTSFLKYRFTIGLLEDELIDALISTKGDIDKIISNTHKYLPIRNELIPDLNLLLNFQERFCAGGIGVVLAFARGEPDNDFIIPVQSRSKKVSDGRNQLAVIPKAFHQPLLENKAEVNVYWTSFRELYEEVFHGIEVEKEISKIKFDWYFNEIPEMKYFKDHRRSL